MRPTTKSAPHWWRTGSPATRKRYPLRWRAGATGNLVAWAEIRDWGLITIKRTPDGLLECRVVDKTRTVATVEVGGVATYADAKRRCAEIAQQSADRRRKVASEAAGVGA